MIKLTALPPRPHPKHLYMPREGDTENEGVFFVVKRTKAYIIGPSPLETYKIANNLYYLGCFVYSIDGGLVNHST